MGVLFEVFELCQNCEVTRAQREENYIMYWSSYNNMNRAFVWYTNKYVSNVYLYSVKMSIYK